MTEARLSIIIPACNEEARIGACLRSILDQEGLDQGGDSAGALQVVVVPNGCRDGTADAARGFMGDFAARGWPLTVVELAAGGKLAALNAGDDAAASPARLYLDADIVLGPGLLAGLLLFSPLTVLAQEGPPPDAGQPDDPNSPEGDDSTGRVPTDCRSTSDCAPRFSWRSDRWPRRSTPARCT